MTNSNPVDPTDTPSQGNLPDLGAVKTPLGRTGLLISRISCDLSDHWPALESRDFSELVISAINHGINCFDMGFPGTYWRHQPQQAPSKQSLQIEHLSRVFCKPNLKEDTFLLFRLPAFFQGEPIDLSIAEDLERGINSLAWDPKVQLGFVLDFGDSPHITNNAPNQTGVTPLKWKETSEADKHWKTKLGELKKILWPTFSHIGIGSFFSQEFLPVIHWQSVDFIIAHQHFGWLEHHGSLAIETFCSRHSIGIISDDYCYGGVLSNHWSGGAQAIEEDSVFVSKEDADKIRKATLMAEEYETDLEALCLFHAANAEPVASTVVKAKDTKVLESKLRSTQTHLPARPLALIGRSLTGLTADSFVP